MNWPEYIVIHLTPLIVTHKWMGLWLWPGFVSIIPATRSYMSPSQQGPAFSPHALGCVHAPILPSIHPHSLFHPSSILFFSGGWVIQVANILNSTGMPAASCVPHFRFTDFPWNQKGSGHWCPGHRLKFWNWSDEAFKSYPITDRETDREMAPSGV